MSSPQSKFRICFILDTCVLDYIMYWYCGSTPVTKGTGLMNKGYMRETDPGSIYISTAESTRQLDKLRVCMGSRIRTRCRKTSRWGPNPTPEAQDATKRMALLSTLPFWIRYFMAFLNPTTLIYFNHKIIKTAPSLSSFNCFRDYRYRLENKDVSTSQN